jgi:hypothetical protein
MPEAVPRIIQRCPIIESMRYPSMRRTSATRSRSVSDVLRCVAVRPHFPTRLTPVAGDCDAQSDRLVRGDRCIASTFEGAGGPLARHPVAHQRDATSGWRVDAEVPLMAVETDPFGGKGRLECSAEHQVFGGAGMHDCRRAP